MTGRTATALLMCDIVGSKLLSRLGDERGIELFARFNEAAEALLLLPAHPGLVIDRTDGLYLRFDSVVFALRYAEALHQRLSVLSSELGERLEVRVGVHFGEVIVHEQRVLGLATSVTARVMARAVGRQTLVSDVAKQLGHNGFRGAEQQDWFCADYGEYVLKGVDGRVRIWEFGRPGRAPRLAPIHNDVRFEGPHASDAQVVPHFTGRDHDLASLARLLNGEPRTVCIVATGIGGIGKTTVATQFVATCAAELFPDGVAWLDADKLISEFGRVARRFGWMDEREPTPEESIAWLGHELHDKRFLIVVDNFDPARARLDHVPQPKGNCKTLVTSRARTLDLWLDATLFPVGVWTPAVCREYLLERCEHLRGVAKIELDALAQFVGHLPLALRLLVFLLRNRASTSVGELLALLKAKPLEVLDQYAGDSGIAKAFQLSYDQLSDGDKRVLGGLAVCAKQTRADVVAAVAGVDDAGERLDRLYTNGFAELLHGADAPWGLHDVVRMFVLEQPGRDAFEAAHAEWVGRHIKACADPTAHREFSTGIDEARETFARLLMRDAEQARAVYVSLEDHLTVVGRNPEAMALSEALLAAAPPDSALASTAMGNLGRCYRRLGNVRKAIDLHERALAIEEKLGRLAGQANQLGALGVCHRTLGDVPKAIELHERALAIAEQLGRLAGQATQLNALGMCYWTSYEVRKAIDLHERALAIEEELGRVAGQAVTLGNLGAGYSRLGDFRKAIDLHECALAIHEKFGNLTGQAAQLGNLGVCYQTLGDVPKAIDLYERALTIHEKLGRLEGQAANLGSLGGCYSTLGDVPKAIDLYERAIACYRRMGLSDEHPNLASFVYSLAHLAAIPATTPSAPKHPLQAALIRLRTWCSVTSRSSSAGCRRTR